MEDTLVVISNKWINFPFSHTMNMHYIRPFIQVFVFPQIMFPPQEQLKTTEKKIEQINMTEKQNPGRAVLF